MALNQAVWVDAGVLFDVVYILGVVGEKFVLVLEEFDEGMGR